MTWAHHRNKYDVCFVKKISAWRDGDNGNAALSWGIFAPAAPVRIYHVESNGLGVCVAPQPLEAGRRAKWRGTPSPSARFGREAIFRRRRETSRGTGVRQLPLFLGAG